MRNGIDLDQPLFSLRPHPRDVFTVRNACEGIQIFGGIGSGKSSGSGATIADSYLRAGWGGLVLCVKEEERKRWQDYAKAAGREGDLIIFDDSGEWGFNFVRYEMKRPGRGGGYTSNVVRLFTNIVEAIQGHKSGGGENQFWMLAMEQLVRNAVDLCIAGRGPDALSLPLLYDIARGAALTTDQVHDPSWQENSATFQLVKEGDEALGGLDQWRKYDFTAAAQYWMGEFPAMDDKMRSSIMATFTTMADMMTRRPFRQLFCDKTNLYPELSYTQRKIIIMDFPIRQYASAGRAAQVMFKFLWQQAMERRDVSKYPVPVFLWIDEAQELVTEYDMQFLATSRSARCATVFLTQNIPNYYASIGGNHSHARTDSLVGNFATKIWHANSDPTTNEIAAQTIGKAWMELDSESENIGGSGGVSIGNSKSWHFEYQVPPREFTFLRKGGPENNGCVEAIVFQNGRIFQGSGQTFVNTMFPQMNEP